MFYLAWLFLISPAFGLEELENINRAEEFLNKSTAKNCLLAFCLKGSASCNQFKDSLVKAEATGSVIGLVEISEKEKEQINEKFKINRLPHIVCRLKNSKDHFVYLGSIDPNEIKYITMRMNEPINEYWALQKLREDLDYLFSNEGLVLGVFSEGNIGAKDDFIRLAYSAKQFYRSAYTFNQEIAKAYEIENGIILFRPNALENNSFYKVTDIAHIDKVLKEINMNFYGKIAWLTPFTEGFLLEGKTLITLFTDLTARKDKSAFQDIVKTLLNVEFNSKKYNIAIARYADYAWLLAEYGYSETNLPILAIDNSTNLFILEKEKLEYNYAIGLSGINEFIKDFESNKVSPAPKSELQKYNEDGIINYVGRTLLKAVNEPENKIYLLVYSDDCKSCDEAKMFIEGLKGKINVKIGQINISKNDLPQEMSPKEVPAFYFIKNSKCIEQEYEKGLSFSVVENFIKEKDEAKKDL